MKENLTYQFIEPKEFWNIFKDFRNQVFDEGYNVDINAYLSIEEKEKVEELNKNYGTKETFALICKHNEKIVGWSYGFQTKVDTFYMMNSGVLEAYRRQGVYTKMLKIIVEKATEKGFQKIDSRHRMTNNAVIIPKLKFGFKISGFELDPTFGTLVHLAYYTNPKIDHILGVRDGSILPKDEDFKCSF